MTDLELMVHQWLTKGSTDRRVAEACFALDPPALDAACAHLQAQAEKALKAFLALHGQTVPRTHILEDLLTVCEQQAPSLTTLLVDCQSLSPFAVEPRYPESGVSYSISGARQAQAAAERIWAAVLALIPPHVHP